MYDELCCKWHQTFYHWKITTNRRYILASILKIQVSENSKSTIDLESKKLTEVGITDRQTCFGVIKHNICQMILKNQ